MSASYVCSVLFRTLLPLALLAATIVRFNALSFVYGILLLLAPNIASPSSASMSGQTAGYMIVVIIWSTIAMLAQVIFQTVLLVEATDDEPYGSILSNCSLTEKVLRQIGLQRLEPNDVVNIIRIVVPDIGMFIVSLVIFIVCRKLIPKIPPPFSDISPVSLRRRVVQHTTLLVNVASMFLLVLLLGFAGIAYPSVLSSVYFLSFIVVATIWACYKTLGKRFAYFRIVLMVYSGAHLLVLYLYQFQFFQDVLAPGSFIARLLGLTGVIKTECRKPWIVEFNGDVLWPEFVSPAVILLLFYMLACQSRQYRELVQEVDATLTRLKESPSKGRRGIRDRLRRSGGSERQSLVTGDETGQNYNTINAGANQPGSSTDPPAASNDGVVNEGIEEETPAGGGSRRNTSASERLESFLDSGPRERTAIASVFAYMMKQSYAGALIIMMAWSITYHSWLTFVLLLVACIIWMIPKKRKACLTISPLIVFYAVCLVIIQYIYGLNLTDDELPVTMANGYKFKEIGLMKHKYPCIPLAVQLLFTCVLWLTLRQFMRDRHMKAQETNDGDIPLAPADSDNRTDLQRAKEYLRNLDRIEGQDSETVKNIGRWWWTLFSKYWIVVCAILFLVMAVQEAVIYRIIYMFFFLYFLITFKLAYGFWRMTIYVFWWVVIIYSMLVLCIIYTYQFEQFPEYWQNSTHLSQQMLSDIGLQQFDTATLFVKLLTPTSFLIVIILQLHYFQKHFLRFSDVKRFTRTYTEVWPDDDPDLSPPIIGPTDSHPHTPYMSDDEGEQQEGYEEGLVSADDDVNLNQDEGQGHHRGHDHDRRSTRSSVSVPRKTCCESVCETLKRWWDKVAAMYLEVEPLVWRVAEVHFFKIVAFTIFICSVVEVSAINWIFVLFVAICLPIPWFHSLMSNAALIWCGIIIIAKMLFQLNTIEHDYWMKNCTNNGSLGPFPWNDSVDNAAYIGLEKTTDLTSYLKNYIAMLAVLALEGIIRVHQEQFYNKPTEEKPKQGIIFPEIKRADADRGLVQCAKFFANYFFFKFGLELCYMITVITMVVRLDIYSLIYGLFLGFLLLMNRRLNFYFWPIYIIILSVLLVLQYLSSLGLPPGTCWTYPWTSNVDPSQMKIPQNLQIFLYLPSYSDPPDPVKLLLDFFQLLLVCLQWRVFYIENKGNVEEYGGGDNKDIIKDVEANAENPVDDFISVKDSYLDYIKVGLFYHFFWVSLVMIFIAGTTRISLFCMGYLVGVFFFLWFGQELLSLPLRRLLKLWHILQGYNYFVLMCKCALQWCIVKHSISPVPSQITMGIAVYLLVGCVYISKLSDLCWLIQLLSIICIKSGQYTNVEVAEGCQLAEDQAGLIWDLICFIILLLQIRVFRSHYFRHVVLELFVTNKLASRGAELINRNLIHRVDMQKKKEAEVLQAVVRKMERLKMRQLRLHQKTTLYSDDHYVVIRSGDYYMFDEDSEDETESTIDPDAMGLGVEPTDEEDGDKVGPLEILNTALTGGTKEALMKVRRQSSVGRSASESKSDTDEPGREHVDSTGSADRRRSRQVSMISQTGAAAEAIDGEEREHEEDDDDQYEDIDQEQVDEAVKSETLCTKVMNYLRLLWAIIGGAIDTLIVWLRGISQDYTAVATILDHEKDLEKQRIKEGRPLDEHLEITDEIGGPPDRRSPKDNRLTLAVATLSPTNDDDEMDPTLDARLAEEEFKQSTPRIFQLCVAAYDALIARSDMLCYFAMILNHLVSASLLSMPYPISVFLWAMLSVPRPTKTYWVTIITYTEAVVVVKYLFQFGFFPWNTKTANNEPFWPPNIIGIEKKDSYAAFDLFLLVCLFVHRTFLKRNGLWKDTIDADADLAKAEDEEARSKAGSPLHSPTIRDPLSEGSITMEIESEQDEHSPQHQLTSYQDDVHDHELSTSLEQSDEHPDPDKKKKKKKKSGMCGACLRPVRQFYKQMINPRFNAATDVYALMFLCDFINFFIIVFGYKSFGPSTSQSQSATTVVTAVIKENKVPTPFLVMLLVQFVLIIIDRGIYLRKMVVGKFLYQILLIILIHVWMFFILPLITHREFSSNTAAQLWYFLKCIYFGLSAYQIRCGYPTRILGNFLTKRYNYLNLFLFKGFLIVPFLLELRALMDWMWTDTTLALTGWLEMEDIYANIFQLKCWRTAEDRYPTPRGEKKKVLVKYGVGGLLLFVLIFIIWFPLLLFSLADTVLYEPNPPIDCTVQIKLGGYQPIFQMSAQQEQNLVPMTEAGYAQFSASFTDPEAQAFISTYKPEDIIMVRLEGESTAVWGISPPSEASLAEDLNSTTSLINLYFSMSFTRRPTSGAMETVSTQITTDLNPHNPAARTIRQNFSKLISNVSHEPVTVQDIFPKYVQVPANSVPVGVDALNRSTPTITNFFLEGTEASQWWKLTELTAKNPLEPDADIRNLTYLTIIAFNDRVAPSALSIFTGYGIIGLYVSVVIVIGQFVRIFFSGLSPQIMFNELPNVDKVLKLCLDIYMVREAMELALEEELFAKLLFLYRSPETLIKWTKHKVD